MTRAPREHRTPPRRRRSERVRESRRFRLAAGGRPIGQSPTRVSPVSLSRATVTLASMRAHVCLSAPRTRRLPATTDGMTGPSRSPAADNRAGCAPVPAQDRRAGRGMVGRSRSAAWADVGLSEVHALVEEWTGSSSARWYVKIESFSCIGARTSVPTRTCGTCPVGSSRLASRNWARSRGSCMRSSAYGLRRARRLTCVG